jgi:hypothetical protein
MEKPRERSPTELPVLFESNLKALAEEFTALAGVPLGLRALRSLGLVAATREYAHPKQREQA